MKTPIYIIQVESRSPGKTENKIGYFYHDRESGYPAFDDGLFGAEPFKNFDEALKCFETLLEERPSTYGSGEFSRHAIPGDLRRAVGERIDIDGLYHFHITIFELRGKSLNDIFTVPRRVAIFTVDQFHNKPNTLPVFKFLFNGPTANV